MKIAFEVAVYIIASSAFLYIFYAFALGMP